MYSALLVLIAAVPAFAAQCSRSYTVKEGDYCDMISAAQNTSTYQLAVLNSDTINSDCTNLAIGQTLCLGTANEDCQTTHVVQMGDVCSNIMSTYGLNDTMLWSNNPNIDEGCTNIYPGEVLCVGNAVQVPPAPPSGIPTPSPSAAPASTVQEAAPSPTSTSTDDDDDENLPFCDEL